MPYEFFSHTGDIGVRLWAASLDALFAAAARALTDVIVDVAEVRPSGAEDVQVVAVELDRLLVDWLSELLYRFDVRQSLVGSSQVTIVPGDGGYRLRATIEGEVFDPERHRVKVLIKAVTYHGLSVVESPEGWSARVIFDV